MIDLLKASRAAEQAVYAAGTHLQSARARLTEAWITQRTPSDVLALIAAEVETLMRDVVTRSLPAYGFESRVAEAMQSPGPCWLVQAVDGQANYLRGYPQYAVTMALIDQGEPVLGVVYDPCRNEFFGALKGLGAVLNGKPIRCAVHHPRADALAATVFPQAGHPRMVSYVAEFGRVLRGFGGVRRSGSMALELAYLAAGRIDAFWAHDTGRWDIAAGAVLLRESGAMIQARDGRALLQTGSVLVCTPTLYEDLLSLLAEA